MSEDGEVTLDEAMQELEINGIAGISWRIASNEYDGEKHPSEAVVIDETITRDLRHGVVRENGRETEAFAVLPLIEKLGEDTDIFIDYGVFEEEGDDGYDEDLIEDFSTIEQYIRENTKDLGLDHHRERILEQDDELYRDIARYQEATLITYDDDFHWFERSLTPSNYLEGITEE